MGVAVKKDISRLERGELIFMKNVAVSGENHPLLKIKDHGIGKNGKVQHHLIHFGVTVPAYTEELALHFVEFRDYLLRKVIPGKIIAGAVIENIP